MGWTKAVLFLDICRETPDATKFSGCMNIAQ